MLVEQQAESKKWQKALQAPGCGRQGETKGSCQAFVVQIHPTLRILVLPFLSFV